MSQNNTTETEIPTMQKDMDAKREMARRLLKGDGVDKDEAKAVSLLEDCVALGDADAMVMLAKCCALGRGMEHYAQRAEALVSEAAEKGNHQARLLLQFINWGKGKNALIWRVCESVFSTNSNEKAHVCVISAGSNEDDFTVESVALAMNIIPCRILHLNRVLCAIKSCHISRESL